MPAKQHAIPQNIMDVEFKLVGDLTLRQFIYVAAGLAIAYISFVSDVASPIKWLIIFLFGGGGLAFAFVPVDDRSLDVWLINFFTAIYSPTRRIWRKSGTVGGFIEEITEEKPVIKATRGAKAPPKPPRHLHWEKEKEEQDPLLNKEKEFLKSLKFETIVPIKEEPELEEHLARKRTLPVLKERKIETDLKPLASEINYSLTPIFTSYTPELGPILSSGLRNTQVSRRLRLPKEAITRLPPGEPKAVHRKLEPLKSPLPKEELKPESKEERGKRNRSLLEDIKNLIEQIKYHREHKKEVPKKEPARVIPGRKDQIREKPSLRQQLSRLLFPVKKEAPREKIKQEEKRPFLDFIREEEKKGVPPQRKLETIREIKPSPPPKEVLKETKPELKPEEMTPEEEMRNLHQKLNQLQQTIKTTTGKDKKELISDISKTIEYYKTQLRQIEADKRLLSKEVEKQKTLPSVQKKETAQPKPMEIDKRRKALAEENKKLLARIEMDEKRLGEYRKRQKEISSKSELYSYQIATYNRRLEQQERLVTSLKAEKETLAKQLKEQEKRKVEKKEKETPVKAEVVKEVTQKKGITPGIVPDSPNIISGVVKGKQDNLIKDAIIIVRDNRGSPVRALKTNDLGQFSISTPLPNGKYQITVEKSGEEFDIIEAEITGAIFKPVIFQGR